VLERARPGSEPWRSCRFLVWGLGNSQWNAFLAFPRFVHERLEELGATPVADFAFGDVGSPTWERLHADWNAAVWPELLELSGARPSEDAAARVAAEDAEAGALTNADSNTAMAMSLQQDDHAPRVLLVPTILTNSVGIDTVEARVRVCRELHAPESEKRARHVEIELPEGVTYRAGDHLGICAKNDEDRVERLAAHLGAALDGLFMVPRTMNVVVVPRGVVLQVRNVLTNLIDISGPPSEAFVQLLREKTGNAVEPGPQSDVVQLLDESPPRTINIFELLSVAPPLRPRYYSTSSSPRVHGDRTAHVAVGLQDYGLCSSYVHGLHEGQRVNVFVDPADGFHLQEDVEKPMIFVSAGTGFAPMRAFLWERLALRRAGVGLGEAVLFNGIRSRALDYIYGDEIEELGVLDAVHLATSREGRREYVQDAIRREGSLVRRLVADGAYVYICGSQAMRDAVREAFVDALGEARVEELETENRYRPDLWG
jgi:cytochrome P450/NADPH-cytochrome P450 reductase